MTTIDLSELPPDVAARVRAGTVFTDHGQTVGLVTKPGPVLTPESMTGLVNAFDEGVSLGELGRAYGLPRFDVVNAVAATGRDPYRYEPDQLSWEDEGSAAVLAAARNRMGPR